MKCSQCGAELFDGAAFCGECGARADGTVAEVSARTDSKPRTRATVNPQRRQRQTAPRNSSDRSVAESLSGAAGLKVYDEAKKNGLLTKLGDGVACGGVNEAVAYSVKDSVLRSEICKS